MKRISGARLAAVAGLLCFSIGLSACFLPGASPQTGAGGANLDPYGPFLVAPITIKLGQSVLRASGSVGPTDRDMGSAAIWEGHALTLEPDRERNRTLFFFVEGEELQRVSIQVNDQEPIVEKLPGIYLSGELSMVRWAQDYSLRVTAEDKWGLVSSQAIHVSGEDAYLENSEGDLPMRVRLLRQGRTEVEEVRGIGFAGKLYRHRWPTCTGDCDLTAPGGALMAMVTGPADTLALILDGQYPFFATGLSYWPSPHYTLVAIPVHDEFLVEFAALSEAGDLVFARWDKPTG
jgi:hypothetical protein